MKKQIYKQAYVAPRCAFVQMENSCYICDASTSHSSAGTTEEGWQDGGTIIDETIEI